jgi:hypothetical protein
LLVAVNAPVNPVNRLGCPLVGSRTVVGSFAVNEPLMFMRRWTLAPAQCERSRST